MNLARRWQNRTARKIVNYPANGFEARDVHQNHKPSKKGIISKKTLQIVLIFNLFINFTACTPFVSNAMYGKNIYDVYAIGVDKRDILTIGSDAWIIAQIKSFLAKEHFINSLDIGVESFYGYVYLVGEFLDKKELKKAFKYAKSVSGVRKVTIYGAFINQRKNCDFLQDTTISANVKTAFMGDEDIVSSNIHVHTLNCKVVLLGIVKNDYVKERAIKMVEKMGYKAVSFIKALN